MQGVGGHCLAQQSKRVEKNNCLGFQFTGQSWDFNHILGKTLSTILLDLLNVCARQFLFAFRAPAATHKGSGGFRLVHFVQVTPSNFVKPNRAENRVQEEGCKTRRRDQSHTLPRFTATETQTKSRRIISDLGKHGHVEMSRTMTQVSLSYRHDPS